MKIIRQIASIFQKDVTDETFMGLHKNKPIESTFNIFSEKTKYQIFREEFYKEFKNITGIPQEYWDNICADAWHIGPELGLIIHTQQKFYDNNFEKFNWNWKEVKRWQEFFIQSGQLPEIEFISPETITPVELLNHLSIISLRKILQFILKSEKSIRKMNKNQLIENIKKYPNFSDNEKFHQIKNDFLKQYKKKFKFKMMILLIRAVFYRTIYRQDMMKHKDMGIYYSGIAPFDKDPFSI